VSVNFTAVSPSLLAMPEMTGFWDGSGVSWTIRKQSARGFQCTQAAEHRLLKMALSCVSLAVAGAG